MDKKFSKQWVKVLLSSIILITGVFFSDVTAVSAEETKVGSVERIDGATREHIAATISERGWVSSDVVFLANGFKEADILTGSPLARVHDAPILFTRDNYLPDVTLNEIQRLGASKVIILGGSTSVPQHIVDALHESHLTVERINGETRYDLAANIAEEVIVSEGTQRDAYVVNGDAYADAISIAPVAANRKQPIYLTRSNQLHPEVQAAIPSVNAWNIIGGTVSIPKNVVGEMQNTGATIATRFDGRNRYAVNRNIMSHFGNSQDYTYVASGEILADALTTSVLAGKESTNILLVKNNNSGNLNGQIDFITNSQVIYNFVLVGGENTLSPTTKEYFEAATTVEEDLYAVNPDELNQEFLALVNDLRAREGAGELAYIPELQIGTDARANDLLEIGGLSVDGEGHVRPDGSSFREAFNYLEGIYLKNGLGENIAMTFESIVGYEGVENGEETVEEALADSLYNQYYNSPGHYDNMIDGSYEGFSTAVSFGEQGQIYNAMILSVNGPDSF